MAKLSSFDFFVYGVVVSITKNSARPHLIPLSEITSCIIVFKHLGHGSIDLRVIQSLKNLRKNDLLNCVFLGDEVAIHADYAVLNTLVTIEEAA